MTNNPIEEIFRRAEEAARRLRILPKIEIVSDPDGTMKEVLRIMEYVCRQAVAFRQDEEQTAGVLGSVFRPGTDLGDLLLFVHPGTSDDIRGEARSRFMKGRRPIHAKRWRAYPEIQKVLAAMSPPEEEAMCATALFFAARVLGGWEDRQPFQKEVELSGGFKVTVRELSPLEVADVLSGDPATLGGRMLHAGFVGAGAYMPMTEEQKDAFFADAGFNPRELSLLLGEIRGFILEVLERREEVVRKALATLANEVTDDLLGPGWRRKEDVQSLEGLALGLELAGAVLDDGIGTLMQPEEDPDFVKELIAEDLVQRIFEEAGLTDFEKYLFHALFVEDDTVTEIVERTRKTPGSIWTAKSRLISKIEPFKTLLKK
jgi:hypothetical protein